MIGREQVRRGSPPGTPRCGSEGITTGPDGALWFTEVNCGQIGRMTTGGLVTDFEIPSVKSRPLGIASGPDGALWFTEAWANKIGRISPNAQAAVGRQKQAMPPATPTPTISWAQRQETWDALNDKASSSLPWLRGQDMLKGEGNSYAKMILKSRISQQRFRGTVQLSSQFP